MLGAQRERLSVDEALAVVVAAARAGGEHLAERVTLADALGRVLAADVRAGWDVPPWPNAAMDGYAVRAADAADAGVGAPRRLRVVGDAAAGGRWDGTLGAGEAVRIATGAPVPAGADAVVRVEDTAADDDGTSVVVRDGRDARQEDAAGNAARRNVRPAGEDLRGGAVAAPAGTPVTPGVVGLLAAAGAAEVDVVRRPRVAIVASGDELVDFDHLDRARAGHAIVNANAYALAALVRAAGGHPVDFGIARDTPDDVRARLAAACDAGCDVVLTTGGVSVGPRDLVRPAFEALGGSLAFWRVRMRPGGPLAFGTLTGTAGHRGGAPLPWFGLPGNPVSTAVTFSLFVRPVLRILAGDARPFRRLLRATLAEPLVTPAAVDALPARDARYRQLRRAPRAAHGATRLRAALLHGRGRRACRRARRRACTPRWRPSARATVRRRCARRRSVRLRGSPVVRGWMTEADGDALVRTLQREFATVVEDVPVAHTTLSILRPAEPEALIDEDAFAHDERLPYWADVWPSTRVLAARLLGERGGGRQLLELGCGSGVAAVAAARAGFDVTATDYYEDALRFTAANVWRATATRCVTRLVDWRAMPRDLGHFDVVVASDVLYERPYAALVARAIAGTLARGGVAYVTDPGRIAAPAFVEAAESLGLAVGAPAAEVIEANGTRQTITTYVLSRR